MGADRNGIQSDHRQDPIHPAMAMMHTKALLR